MRSRNKLPRGVRRRGNSLVVSFALADGRIERRSLGPVSVQYASEQRKIFQRQVREGVYQGFKPRVKENIFTVGDLWEVYLRAYSNRGGKDAGRLSIAWNHLKPTFDKKRVEEVSTAQIEQYIEARRTDGMQNATINREIAALRASFIRGTKVTPRMVTSLPAFPIRLPENPPRMGFVTDKQYAVLAENAKELWLRALIACAYSFGFRKGELLNLRVGQVDLFGRWIELREGETKNREPRKIKMTPEVFELLSACCTGKKPDDFVFTRGAGERVVDPRKEWYDLCVRSGLGQWIPAKRRNGEEFKAYRGLNLHDFRRAAIRNMTRRGVSDVVAMKISGHKTASVFRRYNIVNEDDLELASKLIEAGRQAPVAGVQTDTKTDTVTYAHS